MSETFRDLKVKSPLLPPTSIVIFGGTGDLAQTKLYPALLDLFAHGALPNKFRIIGISRQELTPEAYVEFVKASLNKKNGNYDPLVIEEFCQHIEYHDGDFGLASTYAKLLLWMKKFDDSVNQCTNKLFYLAVPPQLYSGIFKFLDESGLMRT